MAELHFVTGKGGVGKSTLAAALASELSQRDEGPVLLIDVQGSGRALKLLGLTTHPFQNTALPETNNCWGCRILPRETFKQYFGLLLALGNDDSPLAQVTSGLREKITDLLLENRVISAFVDACPGLEPSVLLGKIHWEATQGHAPETETPWAHIVVDAPATGHFVMLFKSTFALIDVFGAGTIFKQASKIKNFTLNREQSHIYIVSTPEELPLQESLDMSEKLRAIDLEPSHYIINRAPPMKSEELKNLPGNAPPMGVDWKKEIELQLEFWNTQYVLSENFKTKLRPSATVLYVPEVAHASSVTALKTLESYMGSIVSARGAE